MMTGALKSQRLTFLTESIWFAHLGIDREAFIMLIDLVALTPNPRADQNSAGGKPKQLGYRT